MAYAQVGRSLRVDYSIQASTVPRAMLQTLRVTAHCIVGAKRVFVTVTAMPYE